VPTTPSDTSPAWEIDVWARNVLDATDFVAVATDSAGVIRWCGGAVRQHLGYESTELIGRAFVHLSEPAEIERRAESLSCELGRRVEMGWEAVSARALEGQTDEFDWTIRSRGGKPFATRLTVTAVRADEELTGFTVVARDPKGLQRVEQALQESEERFRGAFEHSPVGMALVSPEGRWLQTNPALCRMLGYTESELRRRTFSDVSHPDDLGVSVTRVCELLSGARSEYQLRKRYLHKNRRVVWADLNVSLVRGRDGRPLHIVAQILDVTAQHRAEEALRESEERFRDLFENASDMIQCADASGRLLYVNRAWCEKLGYSERDVQSLAQDRIIHPDDIERCRGMFTRLMSGEPCGTVEARFVTRDGRVIVVEGNVSCCLRDGKPALTRGIFRDVTERRGTERLLDDYRRNLEDANRRLAAANARLEELATTDALTGLKNRLVLQQQLDEEHRRALRYEEPLSLVLLDVDHFKSFNDTFGHPAGDEVLQHLARLLRETARTTDVVARFGGEEFAILLPRTDFDGAVRLAERFRHAIASASWERRPVTASFGVATHLSNMADSSALVSAADTAMYRAKQLGRNRVEGAHAKELSLAAM
jgi:diguanylate cyclase (GGDEF)-like protein/PAS domain S-box-containing protein